MNMYKAWSPLARELIFANLFFRATPICRPLASAWLATIFHFAGFRAFPFHAVYTAVFLLNIWWTYLLSRRLSRSRLIAAVTALFISYHPAFDFLLFRYRVHFRHPLLRFLLRCGSTLRARAPAGEMVYGLGDGRMLRTVHLRPQLQGDGSYPAGHAADLRADISSSGLLARSDTALADAGHFVDRPADSGLYCGQSHRTRIAHGDGRLPAHFTVARFMETIFSVELSFP
jgi:hypothetical protein